MAGGRGLRLHPITDKTPKPMLKVGSKPIIRTIVDGFVSQGFTDITLALNYKADLIREYFSTTECGANITYILEKDPLGTGGAVTLMPKDDSFIVSNADVMTKISYLDLAEHHASSGCMATICVALHQQQVHFGVVASTASRLNDIQEKPIKSFQVNAGIYVFSPEAIEFAPRGPFPITDLLMSLPAGSVNVYCIEDFWLDLGRFEDLGRAVAYGAE